MIRDHVTTLERFSWERPYEFGFGGGGLIDCKAWFLLLRP